MQKLNTLSLSQVWFQNARAKLRRSLTAEDPQVNSPSASSTGVAVATGPPSPAPSQPFPGSTIDHLQLSLLTTQNPDCFLDHSSQNTPGCLSEGADSYQAHYC